MTRRFRLLYFDDSATRVRVHLGSCYLQDSCESIPCATVLARKGPTSAFHLAVSFHWGGSSTSLGGSGDYLMFYKQGTI
jgi:hypothetical protein